MPLFGLKKCLCYQFSLPEFYSCVLLYSYSAFAKNPTKTITIFEALRVWENHTIPTIMTITEEDKGQLISYHRDVFSGPASMKLFSCSVKLRGSGCMGWREGNVATLFA